MNQTISIVTAVHPPAARYLADAYQSIVTQVLPEGWNWEWLIMEDGQSRTVARAIPDDDRIHFDTNPRGGGAAIARNLALGTASGSIIKCLDADDMLLPGVLTRDIETLQQPGVRWATSAVLDLLPDGTTAVWDMDNPADGPIEKGSLVEFWLAHQRPQIMPATIAIETDLIILLGGWMALPISEDTGVVLSAGQIATGWFNSEPGLLYRKWPGQTTASNNDESKIARHSLIRRRLELLEASQIQGVRP